MKWPLLEGEEPQLHTHATDCLPDEHPFAHETVECTGCGTMLHAFNNECMRAWVEFHDGGMCLRCALPRLESM